MKIRYPHFAIDIGCLHKLSYHYKRHIIFIIFIYYYFYNLHYLFKEIHTRTQNVTLGAFPKHITEREDPPSKTFNSDVRQAQGFEYVELVKSNEFGFQNHHHKLIINNFVLESSLCSLLGLDIAEMQPLDGLLHLFQKF